MPTMPALFPAFLLLLSYASTFSAATEFLPTLKSASELRPAIIRGLFDLEKRQGYYYCPAPSYTCESYYCCPNTNYRCCRDGGCCRPNTYCDLASNGIIGCCPIGKLCSGPVGDPSTTTLYYTSTSTRTHTSTIDIPTTTRSTTTIASPTTNAFPTTTTSVIIPSLGVPTFAPSPTPDNVNTNTTSTSTQAGFNPNLSSAATGATQNARAFVVILTCSCIVTMVIL